jgi:hypothetical protein
MEAINFDSLNALPILVWRDALYEILTRNSRAIIVIYEQEYSTMAVNYLAHILNIPRQCETNLPQPGINTTCTYILFTVQEHRDTLLPNSQLCALSNKPILFMNRNCSYTHIPVHPSPSLLRISL